MNFRATISKRPADVAHMFDFVAPRYDFMNTLLSFGRDANWRRATAEALRVLPGERVLDLAAGTGKSSAPLVRAGAYVYSLDRSEGMVTVAKKNQSGMAFAVGDGIALPFADGVFDAVTVSFGLRNMPAPVAVLRELARVTAPGGRLVVCEFSTPTAPWLRNAYRYWLPRAIPLVSRLSPNPVSYDYLAQSIIDWPGQKTVAGWLRQAGWRDVSYQNLTAGIVALHRGWR